jgi:ferritin
VISNELTEKLNDQIKEELQSETYYLGMASYFEEEDWNGFAHFMKLQAEEEREHAMKFFDFLSEVDQPIEIPGTESPRNEYSSISEVFETALEQEKHITEKIHDLLSLARKNDDYEAESLLQWFVDEQIEEENLMGEILSQVRRAEGDEAALFMIDRELAEREEGE